MISSAGPLSHATSTEHSEMLSILKGFSLANQFQMLSILIKTDCQKIISNMLSTVQNLSQLGAIMDNIKEAILTDGAASIQ